MGWSKWCRWTKAVAVLRLNLRKPPFARYPGSGERQSMGCWAVATVHECQPDQSFLQQDSSSRKEAKGAISSDGVGHRGGWEGN
jgi:hypothetical protein